MAEKKFSDLTTASQINETDIAAISQENNGVWGSFKATIGAIGQKIITGINFATAFNTNAKTVAGAVNEKLTSNAVADIEVSPAESAHSEGDYLIYNGLLYLVIDDIAIGDALTTGAGGNIEIAQIADGIGGAGHDILNDAGSTLPKEGKLQFVGVYVHDDSINGKTVVENYREMTAAEYAQLTAEQKKGLINVTDEQGHPITASATGFDNTGTSFEGDNVQEVLEEVDTVNTYATQDNKITVKVNGHIVDLYLNANVSGAITVNGIQLPNEIKPNKIVYFVGKAGDNWYQPYRIDTNGVLTARSGNDVNAIAVDWAIGHTTFIL